MGIEVRAVRPGDIVGMTRVILAARGFAGADLERQMDLDLQRFREQGIVELIESEALVAVEEGRMVGVMRYGEFAEDVHLTRPEVDPAVDAGPVIAAFLGQFWPFMAAETSRAVFVDYEQPGSGALRTLGGLFLQNGFDRLVERVDMQLGLAVEVRPQAGQLTFSSYGPETHERFLHVFKQSFTDSLDPMMEWDARHPEESFAMFRDRFGVFNPEMWVLATDREGRDVGFALFQHFVGGRYAGQVVLLYMAVVPEVRGRGYGDRILGEGLRRIYNWRKKGALVSLTVSAPNRPAAAIYQRAGFRPVGDFSVYVQWRH